MLVGVAVALPPPENAANSGVAVQLPPQREVPPQRARPAMTLLLPIGVRVTYSRDSRISHQGGADIPVCRKKGRHIWQTGMSAPPDTVSPVFPVW